MTARPRVVVVGAGFGGLAAVRGLRDVDVEVTLLDQHNYHLFQPLLYQVASALLDPSEIAHPVRSMVRRLHNVRFRMAAVSGVDTKQRVVHSDSGDFPYDWLVLAGGAVTNFFGLTVAEHAAFGLKDLEGALALRNHVLARFEEAVVTEDSTRRRLLLSFVVVGGGPTGVEYAGALSELINGVLRKDFPDLDLSAVRITMVEAADSLLAAFAPRLRRAAARTLQRKGVHLLFNAGVERIDSETRLVLHDGSVLDAATIIWTAGVQAAPLARLAGPAGSSGRLHVRPDLRLPGEDSVFVIGDMAECAGDDGRPLPMLAPVAIQQGGHVARSIARALQGQPPSPFHYRDKGTMATVGRNVAVAQLGPVRLSGFLGWLMWLAVHLLQIVSFRSRLVVLVNWAWNYVFLDRPVRLITTPSADRGARFPPQP